MEPLEVRELQFVKEAFDQFMPDNTFINSNGKPDNNLAIKAKGAFVVMRVRGGTPNPTPADKNYHQVPYWDASKYEITGMATWDFDEKIKFPLDLGLQSISQDKDTLLRTVMCIDAGGLFGNPRRAVAPANIVDESDKRNQRAFACIMYYVVRKSELYFILMTSFPGDGIGAYVYITNNLYLPVPTHVKILRETHFNNLTMDSMRLPYTLDGYWQFLDEVLRSARQNNRSSDEAANKFAKGLPEFFKVKAEAMQNDRRFLVPATYGLLPGNINAANAAVAHPDVGQKYLPQLALNYASDFHEQCRTVRPAPPRGMVREVDTSTDTSLFDEVPLSYYTPQYEAEANALTFQDVKPTSKCDACQGDAHFASQKGPNGETIECAKKVIRRLLNPPNAASGSRFKPAIQKARIIEKEYSRDDMMNAVVNAVKQYKERRQNRRITKRVAPKQQPPSDVNEAMREAIMQQVDTDASENESLDSDGSEMSGLNIYDFAQSTIGERR